MFKAAALNTAKTQNGAISNKNITEPRVNLFYKTVRGVSNETLYELLEDSWDVDPLDTIKLIAYTRDIRGGKGERELFREMLKWLSTKSKENVLGNLDNFVEYSRYDDFCVLMETPLESEIIKFFSERLSKDLNNLKRGELKEVSLLAKWFPSENKKLDKKYKVFSKVAKNMNPSANLQTACKQLRKNLTSLRNHLNIVETLLCKRRYSEIDFNKLPSYAMKKYKKLFEKNENIKEYFEEYKKELVTGESKINASILFPHEIVRGYLDNYKEKDIILEKQWESILLSTNNLDDCIVLSDVSGSMEGTPMEISIAMGILVSSKTTLPDFKDIVLTFETDPSFHSIVGESLHEKVRCLKRAPWGGSTDFLKAMKMILSVAINNNISQSDMPKKLIVVSDMQFNSADSNYYSNHNTVKMLYSNSGYDMPTIVYWNVNGSFNDVPASDSNEKGVALVSGYSKDILKCIMNGEIPTPYTTMRAAIDDTRYSKLTYLGKSSSCE